MLEERHTGKARRPLPSDSALQKMDCKLVNEKEQTRVGSPSIRKQLASDRTIPSSQSTDEEASSPMMSAAKFYLSKVSKPEKIKISIQSNPASTAMYSKTEKHSTSSPNYSILKKKELLTGSVFVMEASSTQFLHDYLYSLSVTFTSTLLNLCTRFCNVGKAPTGFRLQSILTDFRVLIRKISRILCNNLQ